jgi:hypothetical protein
MLFAELDTLTMGLQLFMFVGLPIIGMSWRLQALIEVLRENK